MTHQARTGTHAVEIGEGSPVVLLHGLGVDHRILLALDHVFEASGGWRRIYLDLPGCGQTPMGAARSSDDVAAVVGAAVGELVGDEPFALVGNSYGGMIARHVAHARRDQVTGLATIAAVFVAEHGRRAVPARQVLRTDPAALAAAGPAADDYAEMAVVQSVANAQAFRDHVHPGILAADEAALEELSARYSFAVEPEDAHPEPFDRPALFVTGRQDQVVGYADAWARRDHYPRSTFACLDAAGHNVHLDQPVVTAALLTEWLERVRAADAG